MYMKAVILLGSSFLILQSRAFKNGTLREDGRTKFICPSIGLHADLTNGCKSYHTCGRKNSTPAGTRNCPEAQIFDQFEKECLPNNEANCITCQTDGFFMDRRDHHYYFECKRGMAERHPCVPEGSTFNEKEQLCELDERKDDSMFVKHPDSNPFGFNAQPNFMRAFEESKIKVWGADHKLLQMKELSAQTSAKVGAARASSSVASLGKKEAGVAHSQTSLGDHDGGDKQEVFKGLGSMGGEFSSIHAMATATGTKHVDESPHEDSAEPRDEEPDFKLKEDTIQLGTKRRNKRTGQSQSAGFPQQHFPFQVPRPGLNHNVQQSGNMGQHHRQHQGGSKRNIPRSIHEIPPIPQKITIQTAGQRHELHKEVEGVRSLNSGNKSSNDHRHSKSDGLDYSEEEMFDKKTQKLREDEEEQSKESSEAQSSAITHNEKYNQKKNSSHKKTKKDRSHHHSSEEHEEIHVEIEIRPKNRNQTTQNNGSTSASAIATQTSSDSTRLPSSNPIKAKYETHLENDTKNAGSNQKSATHPHLGRGVAQPVLINPKLSHFSGHDIIPAKNSKHHSSEEHEEIHVEMEFRPKNPNQRTQNNGSTSASAIQSRPSSSSTELPPINPIKATSETNHKNATKNTDNYQKSASNPNLARGVVQPVLLNPKPPHSSGHDIIPAKQSNLASGNLASSNPTSSNHVFSTHAPVKLGRGILPKSANEVKTASPPQSTRATTESPNSPGFMVTKKRRRRIKVKKHRKIKKLICDNMTKVVTQPEPLPPATVPIVQISQTEASSDYEMTTELSLPSEEIDEKSSEEVHTVPTTENIPKKKFALHTEQESRWAESKGMAGSLTDAIGHGGGSAKDKNANSRTSADAFASARKASGKASSNPSTDPLENNEPECSNSPCKLNSARADSEVKSSKTYKKRTRSVVERESFLAQSGSSYDKELGDSETETFDDEEHQSLEKKRTNREAQRPRKANDDRKLGRGGVQRGQMKGIIKLITTTPPKIELLISEGDVPKSDDIQPEPAEESAETQKIDDAKDLKPSESTTTTTPTATSFKTTIKSTTVKPKKTKNKTSSSSKAKIIKATNIGSPPKSSASKVSFAPPEFPKLSESSPIQHQHDPFNLDIGSIHGFHDNDLFPISHSFDHHDADFHTEWETGQEHSDSAHAHIPVAYEKTFGLSNTSSFKTSFTSDHHDEGSFTSGTSETHHHEHSYATEKKKGAEKRMKSVKSRKEEKSASSHQAEDGSKKVFADSKLDHHEHTNVSEFDQHTMDSKVSYHHKKLEKYNLTESDHDTDGSIVTNFNGSANGSEILRSKYIGQDAHIEENVDNKLHGIDVLRSEKQGDSERRLLTSKLVSSYAGAKVMNDSGVVQLISKAKSFTRDLQANNVTVGSESQSMIMNNTYATDTSSQKNMTGEFESGIASQKSRASEAHVAISAIDGISKITDVSTLVAGDTTSKTNKSANTEVISTLQTQTSLHTDRRGNVESMIDDNTRSNFNTRIDNDAKQTMTIVERTSGKNGRPKTEKVTERKKIQEEKRIEKSKKLTDLKTNIASKVETLTSGNKSSNSTGSQVFYVLSAEGKRKEVIARAPSKHKRVRVDSEQTNKTEEPARYSELAECIICGAIQVVAQKKVVTTTEPYEYYSDEESSQNSSKLTEQSENSTKTTAKPGLLTSGNSSSIDEYYDDDETSKSDSKPTEAPVVTTTVQATTKSTDDEYSDKEDAAISHAGAGRNDGEAVAIAASHSSGGLTEVGAVAAAGNGVARAAASAKRFKPEEEAKTKKEDEHEDG